MRLVRLFRRNKMERIRFNDKLPYKYAPDMYTNPLGIDRWLYYRMCYFTINPIEQIYLIIRNTI